MCVGGEGLCDLRRPPGARARGCTASSSVRVRFGKWGTCAFRIVRASQRSKPSVVLYIQWPSSREEIALLIVIPVRCLSGISPVEAARARRAVPRTKHRFEIRRATATVPARGPGWSCTQSCFPAWDSRRDKSTAQEAPRACAAGARDRVASMVRDASRAPAATVLRAPTHGPHAAWA